MDPLNLVKLTPLMELTSGRPEITVGLLDGPVAINHPDLADANIHEISGTLSSKCSQDNSAACMHGTFIAGILCARKGSTAPAICPNCTLLVRPIFAETTPENQLVPSATPQELATAIIECIDKGARVLNLSVAFAQPSCKGERALEEALDYAARGGAIVVAAAGNQGMVGSTAITRHPWVIPVIACDLHGRPLSLSNLGNSIGRRGVSAPGDAIISLTTNGQPFASGGTSVATPFVTGAVALIWSQFPAATAAEVKLAVIQAYASQRATVVPPLLNAWAMYQAMMTIQKR